MGGKIFQATFYKKVGSAWVDAERDALQGQTDAIRDDQKRTHSHTYSGYDYKGTLIKEIQCAGDLVDLKTQHIALRETERQVIPPSVRQMLGLSQQSTELHKPENEVCPLCGTNTKLNERMRNLLPKLNINIHR